jgi:protein-L-isoaspartate O-methyltransferase
VSRPLNPPGTNKIPIGSFMNVPCVRTGFWRSFAARLAVQLAEAGDLTHPACREAVEAVPRHLFTPPPADPIAGERRWPEPGDLVGTAAWLADAYAPGYSLQPSYARLEHGRAVAPDSSAFATQVLHAAQITRGCRVLEVGCGDGYRTALLAHWVGSELVHVIDNDAERIAQSRARLEDLGLRPTLTCTDVTGGLAEGAPYDRIIATTPIDTIPEAWLRHAGPGAIVLAHLRGAFGAGGTACLRRTTSAGGLSGRFLSWPDPSQEAATLSCAPKRPLAAPTISGSLPVDPRRLAHDQTLKLMVQSHLPAGTHNRVRLSATGKPATYLTAPDGSWAEIAHDTNHQGTYDTRGGGPTSLASAVHSAWKQLIDLGHPPIDQFGITRTASACRIWYRNPQGPTWPFAGNADG